jgi:hypothetical protein
VTTSATIEDDLRAALMLDPCISDPDQIAVSAEGGTVTMRGTSKCAHLPAAPHAAFGTHTSTEWMGQERSRGPGLMPTTSDGPQSRIEIDEHGHQLVPSTATARDAQCGGAGQTNETCLSNDAGRAATFGRPTTRCAKPSSTSPAKASSPTRTRSATGMPHRPTRRARARHRGAHPTSPRRAKPRGRPQAPDICTSLRQSPAPTQHDPTRTKKAQPHLTFMGRANTWCG